MKQKIYKIKFFQVGEVYEIYAKNIYQSDFYAFLEIDGYIFDTKNNLVVDTSEEKLKAENASIYTARYLWNFLSGMLAKHKLQVAA